MAAMENQAQPVIGETEVTVKIVEEAKMKCPYCNTLFKLSLISRHIDDFCRIRRHSDREDEYVQCDYCPSHKIPAQEREYHAKLACEYRDGGPLAYLRYIPRLIDPTEIIAQSTPESNPLDDLPSTSNGFLTQIRQPLAATQIPVISVQPMFVKPVEPPKRRRMVNPDL